MMSFFTIDQEKCVGCAACAAVCPREIIHMGSDPKKGASPLFAEWGEKACIRCGHCVAVCPGGALSLATMPAAACAPLPADWRIPPERLGPFLKGRRSVRRYAETDVPRETLEKIIDIARYAPSGINLQPVRWAVIEKREEVRELARLTVEWMRGLVAEKAPPAVSFGFDRIVARWDDKEDPIARSAPHLILAYALKEDPTAQAACVIALTYLELAAASYGLGACWGGYLQMAVNASEDVRKLIGISKRTACHGAMLIGNPKHRYARIPLRNPPKILWK